jgi:asparaginyl-tRNA synthetase
MNLVASDLPVIAVRHLTEHADQVVRLRGWLDSKRSSGKLAFLQVRDGSGVVQVVTSRKDVDDASWDAAQRAVQESTLEIAGTVRVDPRAPGGREIQAQSVALLAVSEEYPITPKEHGTAFLMEHRHLWLRSSKQRAALKLRSEIAQGIRDFFYQREFVLIDSPILTPAACEGTSTLFETDYFGDPAFLSQSGQLYLEPAAAAFGKVYCFGPTFRAEKSKTRRHLMEFWMVEPEVAFLEFAGLQALAEEFVVYLVGRALDRCREELAVLERDVAVLERVQAPFPRVRYAEALERLREQGFDLAWGADLGGDEETALAKLYDRPILVSHYPVEAKAFYMQPDPDDPRCALAKAFYMQPDPDDPRCALALDVLAPEGYGEIIGGSQRIHDHDLLLRRIQEHNLPISAFQWYLDVRRYGTFPHSGFGMGVERFVAWVGGIAHLRETIPYPRMLYKIYP